MIKIKSFIAVILFGLFVSTNLSAQTEKGVLISKNNAFGGKTFEFVAYDQSRYREYFDLDNAKVKTEKIFSEDYPVLNGLKKLIKYYSFDKIEKEEKIFTKAVTRETMVKRCIIHYDRFTGEIIKKEEYFTRDYMGHSMIFYENGKKSRIEWYYSGNQIGIAKNVVYLDHYGKESKIISYFTQKTVEKEGYYKRISHRGYTNDRYYRNLKQELSYSDDYSLKNNGVTRRVNSFKYSGAGQVTQTSNFFDRDGALVNIK